LRGRVTFIWMDRMLALYRSVMTQAAYKLKAMTLHLLFAQSGLLLQTSSLRILQSLEACPVIEMWSVVVYISPQTKGG
jgi:hypothetical protein